MNTSRLDLDPIKVVILKERLMLVKVVRKRNVEIIAWILVCLTLVAACGQTPADVVEPTIQAEEDRAQPYFGLEFPSSTVSRFAPSNFNKEMHASPIFSPDGREVYWSWMGEPNGVWFMEIKDGSWTEPAKASFDHVGQGDSPFISSDGSKLLYLSWSTSGSEVIRQVEREGGEWVSSHKLPNEVNQNGAHWQASMADNGNLYFGSEGKLYFSAFENGSYSSAEIMEISLNLDNGYDGSPFIAPDESYLIFDRGVNFSPVDLFITFRNEIGDWEKPVAMEELNSEGNDLYANVSPDGRFIMFLSNRAGGILLPYWVAAGIIEDYRPQN